MGDGHEENEKPLSLAERISLFEQNSSSSSTLLKSPTLSSSSTTVRRTSTSSSFDTTTRRANGAVTEQQQQRGRENRAGSIDSLAAARRTESPSSIRSSSGVRQQPDLWNIDTNAAASQLKQSRSASNGGGPDLIELASPSGPLSAQHPATNRSKPPPIPPNRPSWQVQPPTPHPTPSSISMVKARGTTSSPSRVTEAPPSSLVAATPVSPPKLPPRKPSNPSSIASTSTSTSTSTTSSVAPALPPRPRRISGTNSNPPFFHQSSRHGQRSPSVPHSPDATTTSFPRSASVGSSASSSADHSYFSQTSPPSSQPTTPIAQSFMRKQTSFSSLTGATTPSSSSPLQFRQSPFKSSFSMAPPVPGSGIDSKARVRYEYLFATLLSSTYRSRRELNGHGVSVNNGKPLWTSSKWDGNDEEVLPGEIVKNVWERSKLDKSTLKGIWSACDPEERGMLDREGFILGMSKIDDELRARSKQQAQSGGATARSRARTFS